MSAGRKGKKKKERIVKDSVEDIREFKNRFVTTILVTTAKVPTT